MRIDRLTSESKEVMSYYFCPLDLSLYNLNDARAKGANTTMSQNALLLLLKISDPASFILAYT